MGEEMIAKVLQMISAAGTARSKYIEAIKAAKAQDLEKAEALVKEGGDCFSMAHDIHAEFLSAASADLTARTGAAGVNLILVHAEDQMMCAETFRLVTEEFIDVYKNMQNQKGMENP